MTIDKIWVASDGSSFVSQASAEEHHKMLNLSIKGSELEWQPGGAVEASSPLVFDCDSYYLCLVIFRDNDLIAYHWNVLYPDTEDNQLLFRNPYRVHDKNGDVEDCMWKDIIMIAELPKYNVIATK